MNIRKIIHIDMDAFYASVEQRDNEALRGKPVVVGGSPDRRGVVAAASYEARKYGVRSAMSSAMAIKRCPGLIFVKPRFDVYKSVSGQIRDIFYEYTDLVEPLSLDEAFLDVTENKMNIVKATRIALEIRQKIRQSTSLTASAGVAPNKFLAKIASDINKPDGLAIITPDQAEAFIELLPIGKFFGIGKATEKRMTGLGIHSGADLKTWSEPDLVRHFGKAGLFYYQISRGMDERPVKPDRIRKSVGAENTFDTDVNDVVWMKNYLSELAVEVARRLKKAGAKGRTVTVKVKYHDFETVTRSVTLDHYTGDEVEIGSCSTALIESTQAGIRPVRLLGITLSNLDLDESAPKSGKQLTFRF
ncbi:MAG: DNA polymerase IV [Balneolaceae bacterium]|nr:MAG: DNA polymerase IV [Balneolaceae bacterium]